jgi:hypothetical protein
MTEFEQLGQQLIAGEIQLDEITLNGRKFHFSPTQSEFISNFKDRFCLYSGGYGCGKSLSLYIKLILMCKCFPDNRVVLGRKTLQDIERAVLPDLFDLMPANWYQHRVKDAVINFNEGSQIILFGLDALQQGNMGDIKKAQQKLKSINIGGFFIDQLEEIDYEVFNTLDTRMRRQVPVRQGNMTTNPANFWAYQYFIKKENYIDGQWVKPTGEVKDRAYYKGSMLDNRANLPEDYIEAQLAKDERFVKRYVYGEWTPDVLTDKAVFAQEFIKRFEQSKKNYLRVEEGFEIYEEPRPIFYQMGIDPSEGSVDPSSISVVSCEGKKVAKYSARIPIASLIEKVKFIYQKYHEPLIIPESNASGAALLEGIKDLRIYRRKQFEYKDNREIEKLGFNTNYQSKQALISNFIDLCRQRVPTIYDNETIEEFKTFVWSDEARQAGAGAQRGYHDDNVMSTLLAYWGLQPKKVEQILANKAMPHKIKRFQYQ